jgi:hypothetical protein
MPETYIIIDALDECSEISQAASWLKKLLTAGGGKLHVLITSRDKSDITLHVSKIPQQQVIYLDVLSARLLYLLDIHVEDRVH